MGVVKYLYLLADGSFQGSQVDVENVDPDVFGYTEDQTPAYNEDVELPYWQDGAWVLQPI